MPIQIKGETYLNTSEATKHVGLSRETLNNYVKAGRLKRYKQTGRTSYYKQADLDKLLELREEEQTEG